MTVEEATPWVMRGEPLGSTPFWDKLDNGLGCLGNVIVEATDDCGTVKLGWEDMDTIILELPALTVLMTLLAPACGAMAGAFTNFTPPVLPFKLCNPGEAALRPAVVMMFGLGAVTTDVPAEPRAVALLKLAATDGVAKVTDPGT